MVKEFLSRAGHGFTVRNVDEDDRAYDELLALGFRTIPVTVIDGRAVTGFDRARLREALAAAGGAP
jgi:glutaredoxin-like protein NrdH